MAKKKENPLIPQPILVKGNEIGLFKMNFCADGVQLSILAKDQNGNYKSIAQTNQAKYKDYDVLSKQETEDMVIREIFEKISCSICSWEAAAYVTTQSDIGIVCQHCWNLMNSKIPWVPPDNLISYIKKEFRR